MLYPTKHEMNRSNLNHSALETTRNFHGNPFIKLWLPVLNQ